MLSKLHSQSLGNIIINRCPCDFHLTHFHKDSTKLHLLSHENAFLYRIILNRLHRLRVQLLGIFIGAGGEVGSRSHFKWHKRLVFTASVIADSTYRQVQAKPSANRSYIHIFEFKSLVHHHIGTSKANSHFSFPLAECAICYTHI